MDLRDLKTKSILEKGLKKHYEEIEKFSSDQENQGKDSTTLQDTFFRSFEKGISFEYIQVFDQKLKSQKNEEFFRVGLLIYFFPFFPVIFYQFFLYRVI